jgi:tripartite-type tricarboxylate transporter receptor subunit TctC
MQEQIHLLIVALVTMCTLPAVHAAQRPAAAAYPERPIRLISPFPPGGSNDIVARFIGGKLSERLGAQVVVDNRAGASGVIGAELAAHAAPDGHTLLMASTTFVMVAVVRRLSFDVQKSFDPISLIGQSPNSIVINPGLPVKSLSELVARAKAKPASILYASTGVAGFNHFGGELFKKLAGIDLVHVPYKGGGPAMIDVIAGQVPMMFSSVTQVLPHLRSDKLRMLAVGARQRLHVLPDIPTVSEAGYPGYEVAVWWGIASPAGVPGTVIERLNREIGAVLRDPAVQKYFSNEAAETLPGTPAQFRQFIGAELAKWSDVSKTAGITEK